MPDSASVERAPMLPLDWLLLATAAGVWGSSFLFMDVALRVEDPGLVAWLRPAFGLCFLACLPSARRPVDRADLPRLAALGLLWMAIPLSLFPLAQTWIDSSIAGMMNSGMPVATLIAGSLLFGASTHRVQVAGVVVGVVGIALVGQPSAALGETGALGVVLAQMLHVHVVIGNAAAEAGGLHRPLPDRLQPCVHAHALSGCSRCPAPRTALRARWDG